MYLAHSPPKKKKKVLVAPPGYRLRAAIVMRDAQASQSGLRRERMPPRVVLRILFQPRPRGPAGAGRRRLRRLWPRRAVSVRRGAGADGADLLSELNAVVHARDGRRKKFRGGGVEK